MQIPILPDDQDKYETGRKIRERRIALGLSQDDLADRMGIDHNIVHRHETGKTEMRISTLYQYASALETTPDKLSPDKFSNPLNHEWMELMDILDNLSAEDRRIILRNARALRALMALETA